MTDIDNRNYDIIRTLVRDYFSLSSESYTRFKDALENPPMVNSIKEIFNESNDYRISFDLGIEELEDFDDAWKIFKSTFNYFCSELEVSYSDFIENKVTINKNKVKLKKALLNFYSSEKGIFHASEIANSNFQIKSSFVDIKKSFSERVWERDIDYCVTNNLIRFISKEELFSYLKKKVDEEITTNLESIGTMKVSRKSSNLKVVLTRNFADWFLASTAEDSWTSCLNLTSNYEGAYWTGLPGTIVDPNRIMIYITDGKKKTFQGIETERFLQRSWVVIDSDEVFHNLKWYDSKRVSNKSIKKITGINLAPNSGREFTSYAKFEPLWFDTGMSCFIYHDNSTFSNYDNGVYIEGCDGNDMCVIDEDRNRSFDCVWYLEDEAEVPNGLLTLIDLELTVSERHNGGGNHLYCSECDCELDEDEVFRHDRQVYCERCYHEEFAECEHCGRVYAWDSGRIHSEEVDGNVFCDHCSEDYCVIDGLWYHEDNLYKIYEEDGKYTSNGFFDDKGNFISLEYDYRIELDKPDDLVYVKKFDMYFPEEMCVNLFTHESWTDKMVEKYNDQFQYKLDIDLRSDSQRERELMNTVTNEFMNMLRNPDSSGLPDSMRMMSAFMNSSWGSGMSQILNTNMTS